MTPAPVHNIHLPQVHIAVNISGLLAVLGSAAAFVVTNPNAVTAFGVPNKNAAAVLAIAGVIAAFLPTKKTEGSSAPATAVGNDEIQPQK